MLPTISQVCSLDSSLDVDMEEYSAAGFPAIDLWLTKLEHYLQSHSLDDVQQLLLKHGMLAPVASFQGGLLTSQGHQRREAWQLLDRRLDICRQLGVQTLVVACDVPGPLQQQDIERMQLSLLELARHAGQRQMRAALEPQARAALGNNLQTVVALIEEVGSPHLGVCLDAFHYHVGPSKLEDLLLLNETNLFHVQLCDLADQPRELASDSDRILPGEGDIDLRAIIARLRQIDYHGPVSVELMNPRIWQIPARQFGDVAFNALCSVMRLEG